MFEFVCGPQPFGVSENGEQALFEDILQAPVVFPSFVDQPAVRGCVGALLDRRAKRRLCSSGICQLRRHDLFHAYEAGGRWEQLLARRSEAGFPPWTPSSQRGIRRVSSVQFDTAESESAESVASTVASAAVRETEKRKNALAEYIRKHGEWDKEF